MAQIFLLIFLGELIRANGNGKFDVHTNNPGNVISLAKIVCFM